LRSTTFPLTGTSPSAMATAVPVCRIRSSSVACLP
jgi:hypothetical protein